MAANYYNCSATGHQEVHCLAASYHNKKFVKQSTWCPSCQGKFGDGPVVEPPKKRGRPKKIVQKSVL